MEEQAGARFCGGVAQLGEHLPCKQGVKSSNLSISTRSFNDRHRTLKTAYSSSIRMTMRIVIQQDIREKKKSFSEDVTLYIGVGAAGF